MAIRRQRCVEEEAKKLGKVDFLAQGTIYPDVIESGKGNAAVIKSHHNVGGLPDHVDFEEIIEPLRDLFKDEVRALGEALGMPRHIVWRQPFPGPGLAIRIIGDDDVLSCPIVRAPAFFMASSPFAPSLPIPVIIIPILLIPFIRDTESNK